MVRLTKKCERQTKFLLGNRDQKKVSKNYWEWVLLPYQNCQLKTIFIQSLKFVSIAVLIAIM
jgi:hypothetical protein